MTASLPIARAMAVLSIALTCTAAPAQKRTPPSIDAFFDEGSVVSARLSPSGRWLARQIKPDDGSSTRLIVSDLQDKEPPKAVAAFERARVARFRWVSDDMLIAWVDEHLYRGPGERGWGLIAVRRDGEAIRQLIKTQWENVYSSRGVAALEANHTYLALGSPGTDEIVVGELDYDNGGELRSIRPLVLNTRTGARRSAVAGIPDGARGWLIAHGQPRMAYVRGGGKLSYHWLEADGKTWKLLGSFDENTPPYRPLFVDGKGTLYVTVSSPDKNGEEVRTLDSASGKIGAEVLVSTPGYSESIDPIYRRGSGEILGWSVTVDAETPVWLSAGNKAIQDQVDRTLKGRINLLQCPHSCDSDDVILVYSYSDRAPGDHLLFKPKTGEMQRVGSTRPKIDPAAMAPLDFHRIKARDGADLPVWITRPQGGDGKPRAAVVLVHGGPWARGRSWEWDADAQFLASRGYVVIEPEFRGSTGYGERHFRAGFRQWGQAMQDDVTDALRFAVDKGWVDAKRVCIAGASYGGYAALMGLAKDPDQYRCGLAWVAVSDPELMFTAHWSDVSYDSRKHGYKEMIGDPKLDAQMLAANSPLKQAARIKAPVLLAYGTADRRVPIEHGESMRRALIDSGNVPEWVTYQDEGHGWRRPETMRDFYGRVERFLAKHLGP